MTPTRPKDERGAVAVWAAVGLLGFMLAIGIGVDFSGHARASQHARSIAREAARAGGQEVQVVVDEARLDRPAAIRAAERHIATAGYSGSATVTGGTTVETTVRGTYECRFLSIIGIWELPLEERAEATLIPSFEGEQR